MAGQDLLRRFHDLAGRGEPLPQGMPGLQP